MDLEDWHNDEDTDSSVETDTETDSDEEEIIDMEPEQEDVDPPHVIRIYEEDAEHVYAEKEDRHYYIGACRCISSRRIFLLKNSVSARTFFRNPIAHISSYLEYMYFQMTIRPAIQIMQLYILPDYTYSVIIKTHWIRLVQRHWRSTFRQRQKVVAERKTPHALLCWELTGRFPKELRYIPSLEGMLRQYSR
jgi:hypothetical protein